MATTTVDPKPSATADRPRERVPRWLALSLMSLFAVIVMAALWSVSQVQGTCEYLDMMPTDSILPGPQPCGPDATAPALVTAWILAFLLAGAFIVAFTLVRRRGTVLLSIAGAMVLVALIGAVATFVAASTVPPIIYY